jgi:hypothetical protein
MCTILSVVSCVIHSPLAFWSYMAVVAYSISAFQLVLPVCTAVHNLLYIKWPSFSCGSYEMAGDCVLVYLTDIKIKTHKFEMLAEKMNKAYKLLSFFVNMTELISKPVYICHSTKCLSTMYEGRSKINASYFIMLAHDVRGGCWWYGNRSWTFPPIFS